jgi:uncharacterized protein YlzI (FlbEa/FlbD family)
LTVATHNEGYFDILKQSVEKAGLHLEVEGWGQQYQGFAWMRNILRQKINEIANQTPNEIVLLVDGFDVFLRANKDEIINKFLLYKKNIVLGAEGQSVWWQDALSRGIFGKCLHTYINSGCIIGYASVLKQLFEFWYETWDTGKGANNDQLLLSEACRRHSIWFSQNVAIDDMSLFATYPCALIQNHQLKNIIQEKNSFIVHGNGDCNMNEIIQEHGYTITKSPRHYLWKNIFHYASFYFKYLICLLLCILLIFL